MIAHPSKHVYLLSGSNMAPRLKYLCTAIESLEALGYNVLEQSAVYETAAWGLENQAPFLNQCLKIDRPNITPEQLMQDLLSIEVSCGRTRNEKWAPRTLDLDILLFKDLVINEPGLHIPHPQLQARRFALVPLNQVAAFVEHPVYHETVHHLLKVCQDPLAVQHYTDLPCASDDIITN